MSLEKSRLAVMPLAVLLPRLGDLSVLAQLAPNVERRLADLQGSRQGTKESDELARVGNEESMLNQVVQWLSIGNQEE
jgi:hypothetical protein